MITLNPPASTIRMQQLEAALKKQQEDAIKAARDRYERMLHAQNNSRVPLLTEQQWQQTSGTEPLGGGAFSIYNQRPFCATTGQQMAWALDDVYSELQLGSASSPFPLADRRALAQELAALQNTLKNATTYEQLQAALTQLDAFMTRVRG